MKILAAVVEDNKDKTTRAYAAKALIGAYNQASETAETLKSNEAEKARFEKGRGKEALATLMANAGKAEKQVKKYGGLLDNELAGVFADISEGKPAPEVESQDIDGKKVKLSQLKGKVVVLDIWATWCGPCRGMIPHTTKLVEKMKNKPFVFVSVSADEKKETLKEFIKGTPMPWTHWWEGTGGIVRDWEVEAFPTIYVIDAKGVIRKKIVGANSKAIDDEVEKLVKEAEEAKSKTE